MLLVGWNFALSRGFTPAPCPHLTDYGYTALRVKRGNFLWSANLAGFSPEICVEFPDRVSGCTELAIGRFKWSYTAHFSLLPRIGWLTDF
jgi:hypothetical protein